MTVYPTGHPVRWNPSATPRPGSQIGILTQPWERYVTYPWVHWHGEGCAWQEWPECVEPVDTQPVQASTRNAWAERTATP